MGAPLELIQELDSSIAHSSDQRRSAMLRHLTDLFLVGSEHYSEEEIDLIDDVFVRLVSTIEQSARALLAIRLGPVMVAPPKILRVLACDDAIEVASPVLTQAARLEIRTLIECAQTKKQEHLLAISRRKTLPEELTDILVERGDQQVILSTAKNAGARFSGKGFGILIKRSYGDDTLTSCVGMRADLPPQLLEQLLAAASEKVRSKLVAEREYAKADIENIVGDVASRIEAGAATQPLSYAAAHVLVESMHEAGQLTTGKLQEFALGGRFEEMVAALSVMSNVPTAVIEQNMRDTRAESLLVLARAIGLSWETTRSILMLAAKRHRRSTAGIDQAMPSFFRLRQSTAQQIIDFHRMPSARKRTH
jgi:uncharacterized protein (DUF2336 family)